jgi:hypothetical protein
MNPPEFKAFPKIPRLSRECIITEKIDGTNACVHIAKSGELFAGSRNRWLTVYQDNFGFARWVEGNKMELLKLGPGTHYGEWWGSGIQRGYGLKEKRFSLFNVTRWCLYGHEPNVIPSKDPKSPEKRQDVLPECVGLVPVLYRGVFCTGEVNNQIGLLGVFGSSASPGFMNPEGVVVYHVAGGVMFKKLIHNDEEPKGMK